VKYSWAAVSEQLRHIMVKNTSFKCETKEEEEDMREYFCEMMFATDTFHPWNTDGFLQRELDKLPQHCNYRRVESYWKWKNGRIEVEISLEEVIEEMSDNIYEWFGNPWNHPPGYKAPEVSIKIEDYKSFNRTVGKIIGTARRSA
jgi:hypothetical protein